MNINWKLRIQNPATLTALIAALVAFVYQVLSVLGITTTIDQSFFVQLGGLAVTLLVSMGIIVDPTTAGLDDSARALAYDTTHNDEEKKTEFTAADFDKFLNTTEESYTGELPKTTKFIRLKGHTIYWGTEKPIRANKGDYFLDQIDSDLIYQWDGSKWVSSNLYAIINEGF